MPESVPKKTECRTCQGTGSETIPGGTKEGESFDPDAPFDHLKRQTIDCRRCGGDGEEHTEGCPRCGSGDLSNTLMESGSTRQSCNDCPWWTTI